MGDTAENKILLLLKQTKRDEEKESNKLLKILRERSKASPVKTLPVTREGRAPLPSSNTPPSTSPEASVPSPVVSTAEPPSETISLPGVLALHLFGSIDKEGLERSFSVVKETQDGWLRYFLALSPLMAIDVAGLSHLPINQELKNYHSKLNLFLYKLRAQWRLKEIIYLQDLSMDALDEQLIHLVGTLKLMVQQGRLQRVTWLDSGDKSFTLLSTLKPDSLSSVSRFMQTNKSSLFGHLSFIVEMLAQEVITNNPGQLKEVITAGETLQAMREKLLVLIHRLAMRSHFGRAEWEEDANLASLSTVLFKRLGTLFNTISEAGA